ncbi:unnamed protein product, partial [Brassica oleracea]
LSHDSLNPAHVPYWWVNNPTLGEFCFTMIGRADTSSFKFRRSKGSIGHAFTVPFILLFQPNSPPDNVLHPDRPAKASLGSKGRGCYPASDSRIELESSSTGSSFPADSAKPVPLATVSLDSRQGHRIPLVRTSSELAVRPPGKALERAVPNTRRSALAMFAAQAARQQSTGSELGPPTPALRANPFPKVTDPFCRLPLPTLFHRPEAVHLGDLMRL